VYGSAQYECNIAMIEPTLYDDIYEEYVLNINSLNDGYVNNILTKRMKDPVDGQIYTDLIKDLQVNNRYEVNAFPMFIDYGILYFRKDLIKSPPKSWHDLKSFEKYKDEFNISVSDTIYIGQFNEYPEFFYNLFENVFNTKDKINYKDVKREIQDTLKIYKHLFNSEIIDEYAWH